MKLLIEIPEEDYKTIKSSSQMVYSGMRSGKSFLIKMLSAVLSGTPIPDNTTVNEVINAVENVRLIKDKLKELKAYDSFEYFVSELLKEICADEID